MNIYKKLQPRRKFFTTSHLLEAKKNFESLSNYLLDSDFCAMQVDGALLTFSRNDQRPIKKKKRGRVNTFDNQLTSEEVLNKTFFKSLERLSKPNCREKDIAIVDLGIKAISGDICKIFTPTDFFKADFNNVYIKIGELLKRCNKGKELSEVSKYVFCQLSNIMTTNGGDTLTTNGGYTLYGPNRREYDFSDRFNEGLCFFNKKIATDTLDLTDKRLRERLQRLDDAAFTLESFYGRVPKVRSKNLMEANVEIEEEKKILKANLQKSWGYFTKKNLKSKIKKLDVERAENYRVIRRVAQARGGGDNRLFNDYSKALFDRRVLEYEDLNREISELQSFLPHAKERNLLRIEARLNALDISKKGVVWEAYAALYNIDRVIISETEVVKSIEDRSIAMEDESENLFPSFFSNNMIDSFNDKFLELQEVYGDRNSDIPQFDGITGGRVKYGELPGSIREFIESDEFKTFGIDYVKNFYPNETGLATLLEKSVKIKSYSNAQLIGYFSQVSQDVEYKGSFKYFCRDEFKNRLQDVRFRNELESFVNRYDGKTVTNMYFTLAKEFDLPDVDHFLDMIHTRGTIGRSRTFKYLDCAKAIFADIVELSGRNESLGSMKVLANITKMQKLKLKPEYSAHLKDQLRNILPIEKSRPIAEKFVQLLDFCEDIVTSKSDELSLKYHQEIERQADENDFELSTDSVDKFKLQFIRDMSRLKGNEQVGFRRRYVQPSHQEVKAQPNFAHRKQQPSALSNTRTNVSGRRGAFTDSKPVINKSSMTSSRGSKGDEGGGVRRSLGDLSNRGNYGGGGKVYDRQAPRLQLTSPFAVSELRSREFKIVTQV